jgi:hypothetical protein
MHVQRQQRLCLRRSLRLGPLHAGLPLEHRLSKRTGLRGGSMQRLHLEGPVRPRVQRGLPRRLLLLYDPGRLSARRRLPQASRAVWRLSIWSRLRDRAGVHCGRVRSVFDIRRLQHIDRIRRDPDTTRPCLYRRNVWRLFVQ